MRIASYGVNVKLPKKSVLLGDAVFANKSRKKLPNRLLTMMKFHASQSRAPVAPLSAFTAMPDRNDAIGLAHAAGRCSQKEIAVAFDIHYATVSRIVKVMAVKL